MRRCLESFGAESNPGWSHESAWQTQTRRLVSSSVFVLKKITPRFFCEADEVFFFWWKDWEITKDMEQPLQITNRKVKEEKNDLAVNMIISILGEWINFMALCINVFYNDKFLPFKIALMTGIHLCLLKMQTFWRHPKKQRDRLCVRT